jgi:hypothetical protein
MTARLAQWIELGFWQIAVRVLSGVRPLSHGMQLIQHSMATRPIGRLMAKGWVIAGTGWLLGLVLGILIASWI